MRTPQPSDERVVGTDGFEIVPSRAEPWAQGVSSLRDKVRNSDYCAWFAPRLPVTVSGRTREPEKLCAAK